MFFSQQEVKDWIQEISWVVAILGGLITAFRAIREMRSATNQRHEELRWKRAQAAKQVLHDIHIDPHAAHAVTMLDWSDAKHSYAPEPGKSYTISYGDVLKVVGSRADECHDDKDIFIRDSFDWFLYYIDRIEHYIQTQYIDFVDVEAVFRPYARKLLKDFDRYQPFMADLDYVLAQAFLKRYQNA